MIGVRWAIPDISSELRDKIKREAYITNEIIIKQEAERARVNGKRLMILSTFCVWNLTPILLYRSNRLCCHRT